MNTAPVIIPDPAAEQILPRIVIDSNEQDSAYIQILAKDDLFQIQRARLEVGDILVQNLIIERKTGPDFVNSIEDGRLFRQLIIMRRLYQKRLLLIEGAAQGRGRISRAAIEGTLTRISAYQQIPILFSEGSEMTARLIKRAALQLYGFTSSQSARTIGANSTHDFYQIHVLVGIPGVGLVRARALIKHFGTLAHVFMASPEELQKVDGIGSYLARELVGLFRGKAQAFLGAR